jgi:hypothetical protein
MNAPRDGANLMAYIFVSDGGPEADEYASNRIWFDERDPEDRRRALSLAQRRREYIAAKRGQSVSNAASKLATKLANKPASSDSRPPSL